MTLDQKIDELGEAVETLEDGGFKFAAEILQRELDSLIEKRRRATTN